MALQSLSFNQDYGCFACGTTSGFRVYNSDPFKETFCRGFGNGGIGIVEMLFRCNILAIVGGGDAPQYPPNKVMIWDDHQGKCIGELSFKTQASSAQVRAVRLRRDRIVVALEHKVLVYNFADLKLLHQIETLANSRGLVALSPSADAVVLACPGLHTGQVRVELYDRKQTRFISAHNTALAALALSADGKRLATCSDKGTLVRVWSTADGSKLQELRRGSQPATIHSIALSKYCEWLAVSSDKDTVHVWALSSAVATGREAPAAGQNGANNGGGGQGGALGGAYGASGGQQQGGGADAPAGAKNASLAVVSALKSYVPIPVPQYLSSEWSFAQFRVPPPSAAAAHLAAAQQQHPAGGIGLGLAAPQQGGAQHAQQQQQQQHQGRIIVGFSPAELHTLVVVTQAGTYHRVSFDPVKGGAMTQIELHTLVAAVGADADNGDLGGEAVLV
ncbi:WD repeat domain phosphoinositide-interacting protein 3 [Monoraphidium neglectum]|uniref:WD repeat domain phosphoinositide-interacting protein 3 n=1 Tax=Monoraphidium neglectum TaxID=145388 RepID=A0A0D2NLM0_9CHLO|nr:WD repeat domain phosphoinositide-interacting protein 3 [Monoraphidium neglectum]KIZ05596.1 WD repeat domain phosphoinositide-interacting protein 3 [Monoraphidium neglectum]|eukprot:XP_013904615.1 WD repeat domain phosphoinositide-interacting protein 3 [Monoraphidium neglectum]